MKEDLNIEELFKTSFENFEAPVDPAVWTNVQNSIASKTAATAGKGILAAKGLKTAALIITTLGAGLGLGYIFFNDKEEAPVQQEITKQETTVSADNTVTPENISENEEIPVENTTLESPKEKISVPKEKVKVIVKEESQMRYRSIVQQWLTPSNRKYSNTTTYLDKLVDEAQHNAEVVATNRNNENKVDQPVVIIEKTDENKPVADFKMSYTAGAAPLAVDFESTEPGYEYSWDFGDGESSDEKNPQHVFNEVGNYTVTLTVKDNKGNKATESKLVEVLSAATVKEVNVFSPDGDGTNDYFFLETEKIARIEITVVNRNQAVVFQTNDLNHKWNGEDRTGKPVPAGLYYYVYTAISTDGKVIKGSSQVNLFRK